MFTIGSRIRERYEIVELVEPGGAGTLARAVDHAMERGSRLLRELAALEGADADERRNALVAAERVSVRGLPTLHDFEIDATAASVVMSLGSGTHGDLTQIPGRPESKRQVIEWAVAILDVLDRLHTQTPPIIHGHVSPDNLAADSGRVFLLCRGDSLHCLHGFGEAAPVAFDPRCAPPERWRGKTLDPRADLFAVGATLHFLATGDYPPDARSREAAVSAGIADPIADPRSLAARLGLGPLRSGDIADTILRALALDPMDRQASASAMKLEIESAGAGLLQELRAKFVSVATGLALCECGFIDAFFHGSNRASFRTRCEFPAYCEDCRAFRLVNVLETPQPKCRTCRGARVTTYGSDRLRGEPGTEVVIGLNAGGRPDMRLELTDGTYLCPSCNEFKLIFAETGLIVD